jgi:hypothetical protein
MGFRGGPKLPAAVGALTGKGMKRLAVTAVASWVIHLAVGAGLWGLVRSARAPSPPEPRPADGALAGETFEAPEEEEELGADETAGSPRSPTSPEPGARRANRTAASSLKEATSGAPGKATSDSPAPQLYGAVGVRSATDLATAFTTSFPHAASMDQEWGRMPLGPAGDARVTLVIDGEGHFRSVVVEGTPTAALRAGIARTVALIEGHLFTSRAPRTVLELHATIARDEVHDGWHGDSFALSGAGHFSGSSGKAFFALPGSPAGRRIDVDVKLR